MIKLKILIAAPICEGKNYSINEWLESVAIIMRRNPNKQINFCFSVNNASQEYENKLKQIELYPVSKRLKVKPIILRLQQKTKEGIVATIARSREQIRRYAVLQHYNYILWLDTDTIPTQDVLERLLSQKKDFISGVYTYKGTNRVVATWLVNKEKDLCSNVPYEVVKKAGLENHLIKIRGCGFGCVLISRKVFIDTQFESNLTKGQGEDIRYCQLAALKGFSIWLDPRVMCQHKSDSQYVEGEK